MKNGKKPTLRHKKILLSHGLDPAQWLVVKSLPEAIEVVSRKSLKKIGGKPKIRTLSTET